MAYPKSLEYDKYIKSQLRLTATEVDNKIRVNRFLYFDYSDDYKNVELMIEEWPIFYHHNYCISVLF